MAVTAAGSPAAGQLYDARRGVCYAKPVLRGRLHLLWFVASLVGGPLLARAHGTTGHGGRRLLSKRECGATTPAMSAARSACGVT